MHALRFSSRYHRSLAFRRRANELLPDYAVQIDAEAVTLFGVTETEVNEHGFMQKRAIQPDFTERLAKRIRARVETLEFVVKGKPLTVSLPTKFASDGELDRRVGACVGACRKAGIEVSHTFIVNGDHVVFGPYKLARGVFIPPSFDDGTPTLRVSVDEQLLLRGGPFRSFIQDGGLRLAFMGNAIKPWKIILYILRELGPRNPAKRSEVLRRLRGKANLKYVRTGVRKGDVSVTVPHVKFATGEKAVLEAKMRSLLARQDRLDRKLAAWDAEGVTHANTFATSPAVATEQVRLHYAAAVARVEAAHSALRTAAKGVLRKTSIPDKPFRDPDCWQAGGFNMVSSYSRTDYRSFMSAHSRYSLAYEEAVKGGWSAAAAACQAEIVDCGTPAGEFALSMA